MTAIDARNLTRRYGDVTAVDGLCLQIRQGMLYALLGVNGAGKTTAIKMLCGLVQPSEGDALIMGYSVRTQTLEVKRRINVSPQETAVAPNLTVRENLELICGMYGCTRRESCTRAQEMIARLGMEEIAGRRAAVLSGGWQRRLSIAMALISRPEVLFLDEPTLGLDVLARRALWDVIRTLRGKQTIVLTTHYLEEAEALSDCIGVMAAGRLAAQGTAAELMEKTGAKTFEDAFVGLCGGNGV